MLKRISAGAVLSLMLAAAAVAAPAGEGPPPSPQGGSGMQQMHRPGADLSRLQSQLAITSSQEAAWNRFAQAAKALHTRPAHLAPSSGSGLTPAPQIFAKLADALTAKAKQAQTLSSAASSLYKVLTPSQRAVFDTHLADFMAKHRHQWKRGHRHMQGGDAPPPRGR